jgi:hypothetical protein
MQMTRTTMLLCAVLAFTGLAAVEAVGTRTTCHQYVCPVEYGFYKRVADWNPRTHECECYPYFTEGPCKVSARSPFSRNREGAFAGALPLRVALRELQPDRRCGWGASLRRGRARSVRHTLTARDVNRLPCSGRQVRGRVPNRGEEWRVRVRVAVRRAALPGALRGHA